eukprot:Colp12_sorted_trinity150504_noHs@9900
MRVAIIEVCGGKDKNPETQNRWDTPLIAAALEDLGCKVSIHKYQDISSAELFGILTQEGYVAYLSRVDPGYYDGYTESKYFEFLERLLAAGLKGFPKPSEMITLGTKEVLWKLKSTGLGVGTDNIRLLKSREDIESAFWSFLLEVPAEEGRVLKQNRGAGGKGTYWVRLVSNDGDVQKNTATILCREAHDAVLKTLTWDEFVGFISEQHLSTSAIGNEGGAARQLIAVPYYKGIKHGERRFVMVGDNICCVVDKQGIATDDGLYFSCTGRAGSTHTYLYDDQWDLSPIWLDVAAHLKRELSALKTATGIDVLPGLWTADFIDADGRYVIGEINCSCFGFGAKQPRIAKEFAAEVVRRLQ